MGLVEEDRTAGHGVKLAQGGGIACSECFEEAHGGGKDHRSAPQYSELTILPLLEVRPMVMLDDNLVRVFVREDKCFSQAVGGLRQDVRIRRDDNESAEIRRLF